MLNKLTVALLLQFVAAQPQDLSDEIKKSRSYKMTQVIINSSLSPAFKLKFDERTKALKTARDKRDDDERTAAGYLQFTVAQKVVFNEGLLKWKKGKWEDCQKDSQSIECTAANQIRLEDEKVRLSTKYYTLSLKDRAANEKSMEAKRTERMATMYAGTVAAKPKSSESCEPLEGSFTRQTCYGELCCGNARSEATGVSKVECQLPDVTGYTNEASGEYWSFSCFSGAYNLIASVAAVSLSVSTMLA